ncbi:MAG: class I SAM-dependent methyltransferase [Alphaproteobacteria bacterium]|nr:class I SAM-dependent methyltransferase [Alphaproteobacteria bacterium]
MKDILDLISPGKPFLPDALNAMQLGRANAMRHLWLTASVSLLAQPGTGIRILEVGSWMGASMLTWAAAIDRFVAGEGEILCVDTWAPYLGVDDINVDGAYRVMDRAAAIDLAYAVFRHNASCVPKKVRVDHLRGRSKDVLSMLRERAFDIVYVDGSHYYADVVADLTEARRLVADGGLLCGDDLEQQVTEIDEAYARDNIDRDALVDPKNRKAFHPGVTLAVAEVLGPVSSYTGFWAMRREGDAFVPVDLSGASPFVPEHFGEEYRRTVLEWARSSGFFKKQA